MLNFPSFKVNSSNQSDFVIRIKAFKMVDTEGHCYLPYTKSKEVTKLERKTRRGYDMLK